MPPNDPGRQRLTDAVVDYPVGSAEAIRVLAVDDDAALAALTEAYLENLDENFDVVTEPTPADALDRLDDDRVDCVVSDYDMPEMDGLELFDAVRETHPHLPFILFTGKGSEEIASDAISAGVTDYLQKGGGDAYELLANRVANVVEQARRGDALATQRRQLDTLVDNLPGMVYRATPAPPWSMQFVGGAVESVTGYQAAAFEDGDVTFGGTLIVDEDADHVADVVADAIASGDPFEVTYRIRDADGVRKRVWERGTPLFDDGDVAALEGFVMETARVATDGGPTTG